MLLLSNKLKLSCMEGQEPIGQPIGQNQAQIRQPNFKFLFKLFCAKIIQANINFNPKSDKYQGIKDAIKILLPKLDSGKYCYESIDLQGDIFFRCILKCGQYFFKKKEEVFEKEIYWYYSKKEYIMNELGNNDNNYPILILSPYILNILDKIMNNPEYSTQNDMIEISKYFIVVFIFIISRDLDLYGYNNNNSYINENQTMQIINFLNQILLSLKIEELNIICLYNIMVSLNCLLDLLELKLNKLNFDTDPIIDMRINFLNFFQKIKIYQESISPDNIIKLPQDEFSDKIINIFGNPLITNFETLFYMKIDFSNPTQQLNQKDKNIIGIICLKLYFLNQQNEYLKLFSNEKNFLEILGSNIYSNINYNNIIGFDQKIFEYLLYNVCYEELIKDNKDFNQMIMCFLNKFINNNKDNFIQRTITIFKNRTDIQNQTKIYPIVILFLIRMMINNPPFYSNIVIINNRKPNENKYQDSSKLNGENLKIFETIEKINTHYDKKLKIRMELLKIISKQKIKHKLLFNESIMKLIQTLDLSVLFAVLHIIIEKNSPQNTCEKYIETINKKASKEVQQDLQTQQKIFDELIASNDQPPIQNKLNITYKLQENTQHQPSNIFYAQQQQQPFTNNEQSTQYSNISYTQ